VDSSGRGFRSTSITEYPRNIPDPKITAKFTARVLSFSQTSYTTALVESTS